MKILPAAAVLAALAFYPLHTWADEETELSDQPAAVQKTAHEQIGKSKIEEVEATFEDGQHATEVEYRDNGKKMAIVIAKDGTLIQKEYRMSPSDAPDVIKKAVAQLDQILNQKEEQKLAQKTLQASAHMVGTSSLSATLTVVPAPSKPPEESK